MDRNGKGAKRQKGDLPRGGDPLEKWNRAVDVDLFLNAQNQWAEDSPNHLILLYEMFLHVAAEGRKEAKRVTC